MIQGKVIAITGAGSGIGKATALHLAHLGAKVVLGARRRESLQQIADQITQAGGDAVVQQVDVTHRSEVQQFVQRACDTFGRLDVLFSNAGAMPIGPLDDLAVDSWEQMIDVNIKGVLFGIAAALPVFRRQSSGHFIHTASTAARKTTPNQVVYSASKAAVLALSDGLRQELAGKLRVSVILPGFTDTSFPDQIASPELKQQLVQAAGLYAMPPDAVARAVAYAIDQPDTVNIGEVVIRSTSQP